MNFDVLSANVTLNQPTSNVTLDPFTTPSQTYASAVAVRTVALAACFSLLFFTFDLLAGQFVSLKSSQVNLRVGPGKEYPVSWTFMWANLPVMVVTEFQQWRKIKFMDGTEGWVHQNMVSKKNTVIVTAESAVLYQYSSKSQPIAKIEKNVICRVLKKENNWIKVEVKNLKGWLETSCVWGVNDS